MTGRRPVAIVTGAAGGIGFEVVSLLAATHDVYATSRSEAGIERLSAIEHVTPCFLDLQDAAAVEAFGANLCARHRQIDALLHVAAIATKQTVEESDADLWQTTFATNVFAPALLTRSLLPALRAADATVAFVNSGAGQLPVPNHAVYAASKHALRGFADTLRLEEPAIRVATIFPGPTKTPMMGRLRGEAGPSTESAEPHSVAQAILWAVLAPADVQITNIDVRPRHEGPRTTR